MNLATTTERAPATVTEPAATPARPRRRRGYATAGWNALALLLAVLFGFPVYWMLITSFKTSADINRLVPQFWPRHPTLASFREVLGDPIFRQDLANTFVITLVAVAVSV
ncbi:MAG: hypothetical protein JO144_02560, partial [Actinobacteria bacterium]|nr:hypothetical protein [Actinomycetota bacterium]